MMPPIDPENSAPSAAGPLIAEGSQVPSEPSEPATVGADPPETYPIEFAMRVARDWRAGKLIGGDEDAVRNSLLAEIERIFGELWIRDGSVPYPDRKVIVMHECVSTGRIINLNGDRRWVTEVKGETRRCGLDFVTAWMPFPPAPR